MGDLHLAPDQMHLFHEARDQVHCGSMRCPASAHALYECDATVRIQFELTGIIMSQSTGLQRGALDLHAATVSLFPHVIPPYLH